MILEACVNSAVSAREAWLGGANRVELCENLADGGTTPSAGSITWARKHMSAGLFVMIRPRGGDFLYSDAEFEIMKADLLRAKELGADGIVFGILCADGTIDEARTSEVILLARPMGVTFHRAFDMTADPFEAMETLIRLGADRILTSGQKRTAPEGAGLIRDLVARAAGRIVIMPGSGVKEDNLAALAGMTGATEFHVHLEKQVPGGMSFHQPGVYMGNPDRPEFEHTLTDRERIRNAREILNALETR